MDAPAPSITDGDPFTRSAQRRTPPVVVWVPHADDETLSMGTSLAGHRAAGRDVVLVLVTEGASAWMLDLLNGDAVDGVSGRRHSPVAEGYLGPLTDGRLGLAQVRAARVAEWQEACAVYAGSGQGRLTTVAAGLPEGVGLDAVRGLVTGLAAEHPGALHQTMSWTDPHPDHAVCGQAVRGLRDEGLVAAAAFSVQRGAQERAAAAGLAVRPVPPVPGGADLVRRAAAAYGVWDPPAGRYGFGLRSVPASFAALAADPAGWVHD